MNALWTTWETVSGRLKSLEWVPLLLVRFVLGYFFAETGVGKVQNIAGMTEKFADWGIPFPHFNAILSGYTELIAGALVVVGLLTRPASFALFFNMGVAIVSVKLKKVTGLTDFIELDELLYAVVFLLLVFTGPGLASLDAAFARVVRRKVAPGQVPERPAQ